MIDEIKKRTRNMPMDRLEKQIAGHLTITLSRHIDTGMDNVIRIGVIITLLFEEASIIWLKKLWPGT